jgi:hypothetical protein
VYTDSYERNQSTHDYGNQGRGGWESGNELLQSVPKMPRIPLGLSSPRSEQLVLRVHYLKTHATTARDPLSHGSIVRRSLCLEGACCEMRLSVFRRIRFSHAANYGKPFFVVFCHRLTLDSLLNRIEKSPTRRLRRISDICCTAEEAEGVHLEHCAAIPQRRRISPRSE